MTRFQEDIAYIVKNDPWLSDGQRELISSLLFAIAALQKIEKMNYSSVEVREAPLVAKYALQNMGIK